MVLSLTTHTDEFGTPKDGVFPFNGFLFGTPPGVPGARAPVREQRGCLCEEGPERHRRQRASSAALGREVAPSGSVL